MRDLVFCAAFAVGGFALALAVRPAGGDGPAPEKIEARPKAPAPGKKEHEKHAAHSSGGTLLDLGNATCPVMGGAADGETFLEWNGLRVGFCCSGCDAAFLKEPGKLLEKVGVDWKAAAEASKAYREASPEEKARIAERWKVVRE